MKSIKRILTFVLALTLVFALFACGETEDVPGGECQTHTDANNDKICDICKKEIKPDKVCKKHVDKDGDGLCDNCGACFPHVDSDEDGYCDDCGEEVEDSVKPSGDAVTLIENEEILFQVVLGSDVSLDTRVYVDEVAEILDELGASLSVVDDTKGDEAELEVLIGTVTSRGKDYEYKKTTLGVKGYAIVALDETKIAVIGGSEEACLEAAKLFFEEMLGIDNRTDVLEDFTLTEENEVLEIQDDYRVTSITVGGNEINDYVITRNPDYNETNAAAKLLQKTFYEKAGIWLEIVDENKASGNAIKLTAVGKTEAGNKGFSVSLDGDDLVFMCGYMNKYAEMVEEFISKNFSMVTGDIEIGGSYTPEKYANRVSYKDFGAKGDGKTDDSEAIRKAHEFANKGGQLVVAESNKTYYIAGPCDTISIKTNVDFGGCTFIFDDTTVTGSTTKPVFSIDPDVANSQISSGEFFKAINADEDGDGIVIYDINHGDKKTTKLGNGLGYKALLTLYDTSANMYIRWGYVDGQNHTQEEIVLIDENGNVDDSTPFLIDFKKVTKIKIQNLENVEPITVKNAKIITKSTKIHKAGNITRNITVNRPYTTIDGIKHVIQGEYDGVNVAMNDRPWEERTPLKLDEKLGYYVPANGYTANRTTIFDSNGKAYTGKDVVLMSGVTYTGIINVSFSEGVKVKNCEFQAHMYYGSGTYDLNLYNANNVKFENCIQTNFFEKDQQGNDTMKANMRLCWGIMGSNYCKNLSFDSCRLTRFDAHCGVYNAEMKNCDVAVIRLIGGGDFILDNTTFYHSQDGAPIQLREDYGATFNGTVTVKDCTINSINTEISGLIDAPTANWDNGYGTYFPNLVIDNLKLGTAQTGFNIIVNSGLEEFSNKNLYPSRNPVLENVHDPDALFNVYYNTANPNIVEENPKKFPYLDGFKKVSKSYANLKNGEYTVIDHGDGTYTVVAKGAKNVRPYNPPEFIEIKNMKNFKNAAGKAVTLKLYNCEFFSETEIIDTDKVLTKVKP